MIPHRLRIDLADVYAGIIFFDIGNNQITTVSFIFQRVMAWLGYSFVLHCQDSTCIVPNPSHLEKYKLFSLHSSQANVKMYRTIKYYIETLTLTLFPVAVLYEQVRVAFLP